MRAKLKFNTPPTATCEVLTKSGNLDQGMGRIWVELPAISPRRPTAEVPCGCKLEKLEIGVYPTFTPQPETVVLALLRVCILKTYHLPRKCELTAYFIGQCRRCMTVYWASGE